jgi:DNA-directed RNA polymerase sigma subunit (sigma70/sigma32)
MNTAILWKKAGQRLSVTREYIGQIDVQTLWKLKHPRRSRKPMKLFR